MKGLFKGREIIKREELPALYREVSKCDSYESDQTL